MTVGEDYMRWAYATQRDSMVGDEQIRKIDELVKLEKARMMREASKNFGTSDMEKFIRDILAS